MSTERLSLIVIGAFSTTIGLIAISLRLYACLARKRVPGLDGLFMGLAWLFSIGYAIATCFGLVYGMGSDKAVVSLGEEIRVVRSNYATEIMYVLCLICVKLSLLTLYLRIAGTLKNWFWKSSVAMAVLLVLQLVAILIVAGFQCQPIEAYWNPTVPRKCIDSVAYFYAQSAWTIVTDIIILALPIPLFRTIKRSRAERVTLCAAFLVGFLSTLISGIRVYSIRQETLSDRPLMELAPITMWSWLETNLGMLCTSGPVVKAIMAKPRRPTSTVRTVSTEGRKSWQPKWSFGVKTTTSDYSSTELTNKSARVEYCSADSSCIEQGPSPIWHGQDHIYRPGIIEDCDP